MADRAIVDRLVAGGMSRDDAAAVTDQVFAAVLSTLREGGKVTIPEVCQLAAPAKNRWVPGQHGRLVHKERKVALRHAGVLERSAPWKPHDNSPLAWR